MTLPLLMQIRADCPSAELHVFANEEVVDVFAGHASMPAVHPLRSFAQTTKGAAFKHLLNALEVRRHGRFDLFVSLDPFFLRNWILRVVPAATYAGLVWPHRQKLSPFHFCREISDVTRATGPHTAEVYLRLWCDLTRSRDLGFGCDARHMLDRPATLAPLPLEFVVLAPGSGSHISQMPTKNWPIEHWLELERLLRDAGCEVVWLGATPLPEGCGLSPYDYIQKTTLLQAAQIIGAARAVVANDSGLMHLAAAIGVPTFGLFGPTDPDHVGPFRSAMTTILSENLPCVPCWRAHCAPPPPLVPPKQGALCMGQLEPRRVATFVREVLVKPPTMG